MPFETPMELLLHLERRFSEETISLTGLGEAKSPGHTTWPHRDPPARTPSPAWLPSAWHTVWCLHWHRW